MTDKPAINDIAVTLKVRGGRYGTFVANATLTQAITEVFKSGANWNELAPDQKEALEMIAHKISRILNGDPNYDDSWVDIAGYAKLVGDRLTTEIKN